MTWAQVTVLGPSHRSVSWPRSLTWAQVIDLRTVKHHSPHQGLHPLALALGAFSNAFGSFFRKAVTGRHFLDLGVVGFRLFLALCFWPSGGLLEALLGLNALPGNSAFAEQNISPGGFTKP